MMRKLLTYLLFLTMTQAVLYATDGGGYTSQKNITDLTFCSSEGYNNIIHLRPGLHIPTVKMIQEKPFAFAAQCTMINLHPTHECTLHLWDAQIYARSLNRKHIYLLENGQFAEVALTGNYTIHHALSDRNAILYTSLYAINQEIELLHNITLKENEFITISCDRGINTYTVSSNLRSVHISGKHSRIDHTRRIAPKLSILELLLTSWSYLKEDLIIETHTQPSRCAIL